LDFLNKVLIHYPHISGDWLITGNGEMFKNTGEKRSFKQLSFPSRPSIEVKPEKPIVPPINQSSPEPTKEERMEVQSEKVSAPMETQLFASEGKHIERILVFYQDKTFREYRPE